MDKNIASNIHNLLKDFYQVNGKEFNEEKATELGVNLAKEITKLPAKEHLLAWNVIGESIHSQFESEMGNKVHSNTSVAIINGATTILSTPTDRENILRGYSQIQLDEKFVPKPTKKLEKSKYPAGFDINNLDVDKNVSDNIRQIVGEYYQTNNAFDKDKLQSLGVSIANEIGKLKNDQHISAWNIVRDSVENNTNEQNKDGKEIMTGALTVLSTEQDRDNMIQGYSLYNITISNHNSKKPKP